LAASAAPAPFCCAFVFAGITLSSLAAGAAGRAGNPRSTGLTDEARLSFKFACGTADILTRSRGGFSGTEQPATPFTGHTRTIHTEKLMSLFGKDIATMDDLFIHTLQDIYYAEKQILKALPEMEQKATNAQLKSAFKSHLEETRAT
jgi:hypothetical protein